MTITALVVIASLWSLHRALIVSGCFAAWFVLALAVVHLRGGRGWIAVGRAYVATFGWGDYITP